MRPSLGSTLNYIYGIRISATVPTDEQAIVTSSPNCFLFQVYVAFLLLSLWKYLLWQFLALY